LGEPRILNMEERILLHLFDFGAVAPPQEIASFETCQKSIAEYCGTSQSKASRHLNELGQMGLVSSQRTRVHGMDRRQRVYYLTPRGKEAAQELAELVGDNRMKYLPAGAIIRTLNETVMGIRLLGSSPGHQGTKLQVYGLLAELYASVGDWEAGCWLASETIELSQKLSDSRNLSHGYLMLGQINEGKSLWELARENYEGGLEAAQEEGADSLVLKARRGLGRIQWRTGDLEGALEVFEECLEEARTGGDQDTTLSLLVDIGNVYDEMGEFEKALERYDMAMKIVEAEANVHEYLRIKNNIAATYAFNWDYQRAIDIAQEVAELAKRAEEGLEYGYSVATLAFSFAQAGDGQHAIQYAQEGIRLFKKQSDPNMLGGCYLYLGMGHSLTGDIEEAERCFKKSIQYLSRASIPQYLVWAHLEIGVAYKRRGDKKEAKKELKEALMLAKDANAKLFEKLAERELKALT